MQGAIGKLLYVAAAHNLAEHGQIVGAEALLAHEQALEGCRQAQHAAEKPGPCEDFPENKLLYLAESPVFNQDLPGFHKDFHNGNTGGTVGLTRAAEQAAVKLVLNRIRILDYLVCQVVKKSKLASGNI